MKKLETNMLNRDVNFFRIEKLGREFWYNLYVRKRDTFQAEASFCSYEEVLKKFSCNEKCRSKVDEQLGKGFEKNWLKSTWCFFII